MKNNEKSITEQLRKNDFTKAGPKRSGSVVSGFSPWAVRLLLLAVIASAVLLCYPMLLKQAYLSAKQESHELNMTTSQRNVFIDRLVRTNYAMPMLFFEPYGYGYSASDFYLPGGQQAYHSDGSFKNEAFKKRFNEIVAAWNDGVSWLTGDYRMDYLVYEHSTEQFSTNNLNGLEQLAKRVPDERGMMDKYAFYAVVNYRYDGLMQIPVWYGMDENLKNKLLLDSMNRTAFFEDLGNIQPYVNDTEIFRPSISMVEAPHGFTMVYALPRDVYSNPGSMERIKSAAFLDSGFVPLSAAALGGAALVGIPAFKRKRRGELAEVGFDGNEHRSTGRFAKVPIEFWLIGAILPLFFYKKIAGWSYDVAQGEPGTSGFGPHLQAWLCGLAILVCWCGLSRFLVSAVAEKAAPVLNKGSLIVFVVERTGRVVTRWFGWLHTFDPSDRTDQSLTKVLLVHFGVVSAIVILAAEIRYYALFALVPYLLAVTYRIKKDKDRITKAYDRLFVSVQSMANGNLDMRIEEDLGVFEPMKREILHIGEGFKHAVEEETKSQRMKSELVTNVSHDLKTPVTAILTYVDLLRQADLTDEERRAYIEVLSGKSQRLSRLIEDLFEYTRASSGNALIAPVEVDLGELLKQSRLEAEDKLIENGVQIRFALPDRKVVLPLDSEKTFRIFENLYLNIAKYAMPGSRAYIQLEDDGRETKVSFKNMSAAELDFKPDEIVERFVRGDRSRHTEGSGLGLAIAKSLVELQGGTFAVEFDGDLFKAVIRWPRRHAAVGELRAAE